MTNQTKFAKVFVEAFDKMMRCKQLDFVYFQFIVGLLRNQNRIGEPGISIRQKIRPNQNQNQTGPESDRTRSRLDHTVWTIPRPDHKFMIHNRTRTGPNEN